VTDAEEKDPSTPASTRLLAATLFCDNCGRSTPHRILRLDRTTRTGSGRIRGVARCRDCRFTHPFESVPEERGEVALIVSAGPRSEHTRVSLPRWRKLQVGTGLPESALPLTIRRLEAKSGRAVTSGLVGDVTTVWATRDEGAIVLVSVVEGRRTESIRLPLPHGTRLRVGAELHLEEMTVEIVGLRARGHTWRRIDDEFPADEVDRVYSRRISSPPAGNSPWRRVRVSPSSRASSTSTRSRSRSTPGTRTTRTLPRTRIAVGGAAVQSESPR
jgi:uncharacterized Zn finger protein